MNNAAPLLLVLVCLSRSAAANGPLASPAPPSQAPRPAAVPLVPAAVGVRTPALTSALEAALARRGTSVEQFLALPEEQQAQLAQEATRAEEPVAAAKEAPPVEAADAAKIPGVGLEIAKALLGVLADTQNSDERPAVLKRLDDLLWKRYGEDAVGEVVVAGLAKEMTDETESEELMRMASTIEGAVRRGSAPRTRREGVAALAKAASLLAASDDDEAVPMLEKLETAALDSEDLDVRRSAIAALRAQRADYEADTDYGAALEKAIANLKDSFQEAAADKNDPGVAVTLALTQALARSRDEEDGARIVARLSAAAETYPSPAAQRVALRGLLRALRRSETDELAKASIEAVEKLAAAGSEHVKRSAKVALKRLSGDEDFSYASESGEALERIDGGAPKASVSVPAPESTESPAEIRRSSGRSLLLSVAVGAAALAALWLFGGF